MIDSPNAETICDRENPRYFKDDAKHGSKALGEAINSLFERMPARKVAEVIGKAHLIQAPGTERIFYGQLAQRRLAA